MAIVVAGHAVVAVVIVRIVDVTIVVMGITTWKMTWRRHFAKQLCPITGTILPTCYNDDVTPPFYTTITPPVAGTILPTWVNDDVVSPFCARTLPRIVGTLLSMCVNEDVVSPFCASTVGLVTTYRSIFPRTWMMTWHYNFRWQSVNTVFIFSSAKWYCHFPRQSVCAGFIFSTCWNASGFLPRVT